MDNIRKEDVAILERCADQLNSEYIGMFGEVGDRRSYGEFSSLTQAEQMGFGRIHPEVYSLLNIAKNTKKWCPVSSI